MNSLITALPSPSNILLASSISRPGTNSISIQPLDSPSQQQQQQQEDSLNSTINFENDESVSSLKWIRLPNSKSLSSPSSNKKRRNSNNSTTTVTPDFIDYLVILLTTGEILIYSTLTKEVVNKISSDSPFSTIEVIPISISDSDLVAFDPSSSSLKFFSSSSPQLIKSIPFKNDTNISYIYSDPSSSNLILASNDHLYLLDDEYKIKKSVDITPIPSSPTKSKLKSKSKSKPKPKPKSSQSQLLSPINKIIKNDLLLYITRIDSPIVQIIDMSKKKPKLSSITASNNISDISLINIHKSVILAATLIDGSIELFNSNSNSNSSSNFARLEIDGGSDVGRFIALLNSNSIIDGVYKGIWYDNFNIQITDFEFENISKLNGDIKISVTELSDPNNELLELADDDDEDDDEEEDEEEEEEEDDEEGENEQEEEADNDINDDVNFKENKDTNAQSDIELDNADDDDDTNKDYTCTELTQLTTLIKPRLITSSNKKSINEYDVKLSHILSQNTSFAKSAIYLLSTDESVILFNKIAFIISHYQSQLLNQDFDFINNIKIWLKWLLILRATILSQNDESIGWLKLLQSEFKQDAKKLNGLIKLTGKLTLLRDQLNVRKEIMDHDNNLDNEESELEDTQDLDTRLDETTFGEGESTSVVLDGEGGFDDEDDEE